MRGRAFEKRVHATAITIATLARFPRESAIIVELGYAWRQWRKHTRAADFARE